MYKFGRKSKEKLETLHPLLQKVLKRAIIISRIDFAIVSGHRDKELQDSLVRSGHSKLNWPDSKHNKIPSEAVDIAVYMNGKINWNNIECYHYLAGVILTVAMEYKVKLRCGLDWDMDGDPTDQTFIDAGHYEIVEMPDDEGV